MQLDLKIFCLLPFLLLPLLGIAQVDYAQKILDSLAKETNPKVQADLHNDLAFHFGETDSLKADYHTRKALKIARTFNLQKEIAKAYKNFGVFYGHHNAQKLAIQYYDTAYQMYQVLADTSGMLAVLNNGGRRHCYLGDCEVGIQKYHLAESLLKPTEETKFVIVSINHGICLMECRAYESCIELCQKALPFAKKLEYLNAQFSFHKLMGNSYVYLKQNEKGLAQLKMAKEIALKMSPLAVAAILNDEGDAYYEMGFYENAFNALQKSLSIAEENGVTQHDHRVLLNLGEVAKYLGKYKESVQYFEQGLKGSERTKDNVILADSYELAAESYNYLGNDQKAYEYLVKAKTFRDSVFTNEMRQNLQEITTRYKTEKIKKELAASNLEIEQERNQNRLTLIGGLSLLVLCGIGYVFFRGRQRRQRLETEKRKVELEYGLLRAQMNPHFVFNSLNSIQGYFADNQFAQGNEFLGKFSHLIRRVLDQSVAPAILFSEEIKTLKLYLDVETIRLKDKLTYEVIIDENVEVDFINVPPLVLQPFVENAIWHGIAPKNSGGKITIHCQVTEDDQFLQVQIVDDGVGLSNQLPKDKKHISKGIKITKERLGKHGTVKIIDRKKEGGEGVKVALKIPIIDE